ncbi:hypothetical protein K474DRAFT_500898 [Panus rudis PR-1116 ss-1]|nr:hypothetical protein K474DRAFT_500898 [Panus rudis PR-1116 ss-1]
MSKAKTILFPPPPPTSNHTDPHRRLRLKRSARKLSEFLGTTPCVVDIETRPLPITLLPVGASSGRRSTSNSTRGSFESEKTLKRQGSVFNCGALPPGPINSASSLSTALSSTVSLSLSALPADEHSTPSVPSHKPKKSKDTPQPLVLRLTPPSRALKASTASDASAPSTPFLDTPPTTAPVTPVTPTSTETRRKRVAKLTRVLGERIPPQLVTSAAKSLSRGALTPTWRKKSFFQDCPPSPVSTSTPDRTHRRRSMSVDYSAGVHGGQNAPLFVGSRSSRVWVVENKTWRGEWNRRDIRDVQDQLRYLKAR